MARAIAQFVGTTFAVGFEASRLADLAVLSKGLRDPSAITRSSIHWRDQPV